MNAPMTTNIPFYEAAGNEVEVFEQAWKNRLPLLIKGPTGVGKTRFVAHMAAKLGLPLYTVACHDDLTAADLVGRHLLGDGQTVWCDGPLTRAVRGEQLSGVARSLGRVAANHFGATQALASGNNPMQNLIMAKVPITVMIALSAWDRVCWSVWLMLSTSLVTRESMSPRLPESR